MGTSDEDPISVPIEVKLSNNPEAKSGLFDQLVSRYMPEAGTSLGVFVMVWMDAPRLARSARPLWPDVAAAKTELHAQAREAMSGGPEGSLVRAFTLDASLPTVKKTNGRKSTDRRKPQRGRAVATSKRVRPLAPKTKKALKRQTKKGGRRDSGSRLKENKGGRSSKGKDARRGKKRKT